MPHPGHYRSIIYRALDESKAFNCFEEFTDWIWEIMDGVLRHHDNIHFASVSVFHAEGSEGRHPVFWAAFPKIEVDLWFERAKTLGKESPTYQVATKGRNHGYYRLDKNGGTSWNLIYWDDCVSESCTKEKVSSPRDIDLGGDAKGRIEELETCIRQYSPDGESVNLYHLTSSIGAHLPAQEPAVLYVCGDDGDKVKAAFTELRCALTEAFSLEVKCKTDDVMLSRTMNVDKPIPFYALSAADAKEVYYNIFNENYHDSQQIENAKSDSIPKNLIRKYDVSRSYYCVDSVKRLFGHGIPTMVACKIEMGVVDGSYYPLSPILACARNVVQATGGDLKYDDLKECIKYINENHDKIEGSRYSNNSGHTIDQVGEIKWGMLINGVVECHIEYAVGRSSANKLRYVKVKVYKGGNEIADDKFDTLTKMSTDENTSAFICLKIQDSKYLSSRFSGHDGADSKKLHDIFNIAKNNGRLVCVFDNMCEDDATSNIIKKIGNIDSSGGSVVVCQQGDSCIFFYQIR